MTLSALFAKWRDRDEQYAEEALRWLRDAATDLPRRERELLLDLIEERAALTTPDLADPALRAGRPTYPHDDADETVATPDRADPERRAEDAYAEGALRVLDVLEAMAEAGDKGDSWPDYIDTARYVIRTDGLDALTRRAALTPPPAGNDR